jgi:apolipoprotein D and lipocalin family protein
MKPACKAVLLLVLWGVGAGCTGIPDGVTAVSDFEFERYLGTWYEIARLDHRFERGLSNVTATYTPRDDGGIDVVNRGYDESAGEWDEATGKAYFVGDPGVGRLKVSFFGPFYGAYNILELDREAYRYALVAGPNRSYLWILARSPVPDPATVERLVATAAELGFPTGGLIRVQHDRAPEDAR